MCFSLEWLFSPLSAKLCIFNSLINWLRPIKSISIDANQPHSKAKLFMGKRHRDSVEIMAGKASYLQILVSICSHCASPCNRFSTRLVESGLNKIWKAQFPQPWLWWFAFEILFFVCFCPPNSHENNIYVCHKLWLIHWAHHQICVQACDQGVPWPLVN